MDCAKPPSHSPDGAASTGPDAIAPRHWTGSRFHDSQPRFKAAQDGEFCDSQVKRHGDAMLVPAALALACQYLISRSPGDVFPVSMGYLSTRRDGWSLVGPDERWHRLLGIAYSGLAPMPV
uniref:Uncharacterized protein n=1 Tax=Coccidioides posadasii RMSCC 3488 TaxID=454284 RepID=A0A0J6FAM0_COCPO|nr:hypothetical protein CPAG_02330 [Coccidioides posadasii RMSCC 3488]